MTNTTLPKTIQDRYLAAAIAEHRTWQQAERINAIAEIAELETELESEIHQLDEAIQQAEAAVKSVEDALAKAKAELAEAEAEKRRREYHFDRQLHALRERVQYGDLVDQGIADALQNLTELENDARQIKFGPLDDAKGHMQFPKVTDREVIEKVRNRLQWIRDVGRPQITALKTSIAGSEELDQAIRKIMAGMPAL